MTFDTLLQSLQEVKMILRNTENHDHIFKYLDNSVLESLKKDLNSIINVNSSHFFINDILKGAEKRYFKRENMNNFEEIEEIPDFIYEKYSDNNKILNPVNEISLCLLGNNEKINKIHNSQHKKTICSIQSMTIGNVIIDRDRDISHKFFSHQNSLVIKDNRLSKSPIRPRSSKLLKENELNVNINLTNPVKKHNFIKITEETKFNTLSSKLEQYKTVENEKFRENSKGKFNYETLKTINEYPTIREEILKVKEKIMFNKGHRDNYFKKISKGNYERYLLLNNVFRIIQKEHTDKSLLDLTILNEEDNVNHIANSKFTPIRIKSKSPIGFNLKIKQNNVNNSQNKSMNLNSVDNLSKNMSTIKQTSIVAKLPKI